MGPWSILAAWWLPLPAVFGLKGHSLVFDTGAKIPTEAAFLAQGPRVRSGRDLSTSSTDTCRPQQKGNAMRSQAAALKTLLDQPGLQIMPGCGDGMGARLIEEAGFPTGFVSGSSIAAM